MGAGNSRKEDDDMFWVAMIFCAVYLVSRVGEEVLKANKAPEDQVRRWGDVRDITQILALITSTIAMILMMI